MFENLIQIGEMRARFLKAGDIIGRHSGVYQVTDTPVVASLGRPGHIVLVCRNETGGFEPLSMNSELMVQLFTAVNEEEFRAATAKFF